MTCHLSRSQRGFTLIELVVVIVVAGILAALGGQFIVAPVTGYIDMARRTRLVDQAEMALRRMQRDVRQALPNSVRITGGGQFLELLHTTDGGRYRHYQDPAAGGDDILDFSAADTSFDVLGDLRANPTAGTELVVYNVSASGASGNAYYGTADNVASVTGGSVSTVTFSSTTFGNQSPYQRFFIIDGPVTYACEGGVLNRYAGAGYSRAQNQPTPPGITPAIVTRNVSDCNFTYVPGASQRAGLVTLELSLTESGETISLLHQIHVVNAP